MPIAPDPSFTWQVALAAFTIIAVVAFLVTWVVTDLLGLRRTPYIAVLSFVTLDLLGGYLAWSGLGLADLITERWGAAVVAGLVAAIVVAPGVRRLPAGIRPHGTRLAGRLAWEGLAYGVSEALLLATLPVLAVWQACDALGWTDGGWASAGSGTLAIVGALAVITVHHLGYREFRGRRGRTMLAGALLGCGIQALAFLFTGNVLAPIVAHVLLHTQMILRGVELPPVRRVAPGPARAVHEAPDSIAA
jgi:hypothetical protein